MTTEIDQDIIDAGNAEMAPQVDKLNIGLEHWLIYPQFHTYVGRSVAMKLEILAAVIKGTENISAIARRHGVSKQAGHAMAKRARKVLGQSLG